MVLEGGASTPGSERAEGAGLADNPTDSPTPPVPPGPGDRGFRDTFTVTELPGVTLNDIAAFRPDEPVDHMQPNGWTVAGLDTNFYATGGSQVENGTLLGLPAAVRFTPVAWHWSYGDGTAATLSTPGGTWASRGIREFDPTATSHIYESLGSYVIDLTVDYAAEYRFAGGGWLGIDGVLSVPANRLSISVGTAKTVLVQHDCAENRGGPGC